MKEKPILFSSAMINAILSNRKSQTRRIVKPSNGLQRTWLTQDLINEVPHGELINGGWQMHHPYAGQRINNIDISYDSPLGWVKCPYGKPGDILWVRETWQEIFELEYDHFAMDGSYVNIREWITNFDSIDKKCVGLSSEWSCASMPEREKYYVYKTSDIRFSDEKHKLKWKSPIFMPKEASRIKLKVTNVRVERVQDITEEDAVAEGVSLPNYAEQAIKDVHYPEPSAIYASLWESINGKDSWKSNPWVWVIEFERI